jgi:hypothetical protein
MSGMDRELDRLLRELRDEALPESALEATRVGVRARIAAGRRRRAVAPWLALAATAAAALWFTVIVVREPLPARLPVVAFRTPAVPEAEFQRGVSDARSRLSGGSARGNSAMLRAGVESYRSVRRSRSVASNRSAGQDRTAKEPEAEETQFIRMVTDDPNVVILWALNSKGETR